MGCCLPRPKSNRATLCCCSLRVGAFFASLFILLNGVADIVECARNRTGDFLINTQFFMAVIMIVVSSVGLLTCLCRWKAGAKFSVKGVGCLMVPVVVKFVLQWTGWILKLGGVSVHDWEIERGERWIPDTGEIVEMVVSNLATLITLWLCHKTQSTFASLRAVWGAGGSGFERKKADDVDAIEEDRQARERLNEQYMNP